MLVLSRCEGERIIINGNIYVSIERVWRHGRPRVSIGIEAPVAISVHREEVQVAIERREGGGR